MGQQEARSYGRKIRAAMSIGTLILLALTAGPLSAAQPRTPLTFKGIALGMTKRDVCSQVMGMAFANEVACRTWEGDTLTPPRPHPIYDRVGPVPVNMVVHFNQRDDPDARVDEIILDFSHADYPAMRAVLTQQYGRPADRDIGEIRVGLTEGVASETVVWRQAGGILRLLEQFGQIGRSGLIVAAPDDREYASGNLQR